MILLLTLHIVHMQAECGPLLCAYVLPACPQVGASCCANVLYCASATCVLELCCAQVHCVLVCAVH